MSSQAVQIYERIRKGTYTTTDLRTFAGLTRAKQLRAIEEVMGEKKQYIYMITFTIGPHCQLTEEEIQEYIEAQGRRKALRLTRWSLVKEYTKAGTAHWHVLAISTIPLKKDRFNYYKKLIGNLDLSKNKAQTDTEILNYMSKSGDIKDIL